MPFEMVAKRYSFSSQCSLLISLKTSENQKLSDVLNIRKPKVVWCFEHQKTKSFLMFSGEWKGNIGKRRIKTNWYTERNKTSLRQKKLNTLIWQILKTWTLKMMRMLSSMMMMMTETNESDESDEEKRRNLILLMWSGLNMVGFGILIKYIVSMVRG